MGVKEVVVECVGVSGGVHPLLCFMGYGVCKLVCRLVVYLHWCVYFQWCVLIAEECC